jgi:hypothetical protein
MNAFECHERAAQCAANAAEAQSEALSQEFLKLAAQWRAMAVRHIFLGRIDGLETPMARPVPLPPLIS